MPGLASRAVMSMAPLANVPLQKAHFSIVVGSTVCIYFWVNITIFWQIFVKKPVCRRPQSFWEAPVGSTKMRGTRYAFTPFVFSFTLYFSKVKTTGEKSDQNAVVQQARTQPAKPDHAEKLCVPRVWRASRATRATLGARMFGLRGLVLWIVSFLLKNCILV